MGAAGPTLADDRHRPWPGPGTQLTALLGTPVRHSLSPAIHNAAFAARGLDWAFVVFEVASSAAAEALTGATALGVRGLSITMPLKTVMADLVDRLSPAAAALRAVNTVVLGPDGSFGDNTDGGGFLDALQRGHEWLPTSRRCLVHGAGGAARAVVLALAEGGAAEVIVVNRDPSRAHAAAALAGAAGRVGTAADAEGADLVVNATPVGMANTGEEGGLPLNPLVLHPGQLVVDLVYHPPWTGLLAAAAARGAETESGVGMLVHQAARAFELWTGEAAPLDAMAAAARQGLAGSAARQRSPQSGGP